MDGYKDKHTPWRDAELLEELYVDQGLSQPQISERFGCTSSTVSRWLDNHGIDRDRPWRDADLLREKYHDEGMSAPEIAEEIDCNSSTVLNWMDKLGVERRTAADRPANFRSMHAPSSGYEFWECAASDKIMYVHRLLAIAEYGIEAVKENDVHHKKEIPWLNTPGNIELMDPSEHRSHHALKRGAIPPWQRGTDD